MEKWALVTGASTGIGYAISERLADKGYNLIMVSRNQARLDAAVASLESLHKGLTITSVAMDLCRQGAADSLFALTSERGIVPDVLVNDAGMFLYDNVIDTDPRKLSDMVMLHNHAVTMMCRLYGAAMAGRGGGRIMNMSSYSIFMPYPGLAAYSGTKAYVRAFSKVLRKELRPLGVSVTVAAPAGVDTDLMGLPENIRSLAGKTGFLMRPSTAARRIVRATLHGRRFIVPGFYNYLWLPFLPLFSPVSSLILNRRRK